MIRILTPIGCAAILLTALMSLSCSASARDASDMYPDAVDPFMGNWVGRWCAEEEVDPDIAAQVIPHGKGKYEIRIVSKLFMRCPPEADFEADANGDTITFDQNGIQGTIKGDTFTGKSGKKTFEMKKYVHQCAALGAAPPAGAIVLFDGTNFDQWETPTGWEILEGGIAMVTPKGKELVSKVRLKDLKLHVEFCLPYMPFAREQQRGNSGVFVQDVYEVQVLDSYGLEGYYNECGAMYKVAAPKVNACLPPLVWQVYDIEYHGPQFDADGKVTANARITVFQNGVCIQDNQELPQITAWKEVERLAPPPKDPGAIKLQAHNNYVQYRNVWVVDLDAGK